MILGIVLAAGRSRRMGAPKALLELEGETFLARVASALREGGCDAVRAVVPPEPPEIGSAAAAAGAEVVRNPDEDAEQIDSLRLGLADAPDALAAVVCPVDVPAVSADVVRRLISTFHQTGAPIVRAVHQGKHGHPVLFGSRLFPELWDEALQEGARDVIHRHAAEVVEVEVPEGAVLLDVDTPADLTRLREELG